MSRRVRHFLLYMAAMAAGVAVSFAVAAVDPVGAAAPQSANFRAVDFKWEVPETGESTATIAEGGTVTFGYPSGSSFHNADFSGADPTSCTQTAGQNSGPVPPLPAFPQGQGWSGNCTFNTPGTYSFLCQAHPQMTGTIVVEAAGSTDTTDTTTTTGTTGTTGTTETTDTTTTPTDTTDTTTTPTDTTDTTTTPTNTTMTGAGPTNTTTAGTGTTTTPGGPPSPPALPRAIVAPRQRGAVLRGAVTTPAAGSRVVVAAFVSSRALAKPRPKRARLVRVGSQTRRSTGTGRTSFAVRLNAAARRALRRRHRLAVNLRILVTPPGGRTVKTTAAVLMRDR